MGPTDPRGKPAKGPLSGILVADFSRILAGPYATMMLGDLGAEVIKVESPAGDDTREWVPPRRGRRRHLLPRGQPQQALDRARPVRRPGRGRRPCAVAARGRVHPELPARRPGPVRPRLRSVARRNPAIIYCSISGFGAGKGASLPGYDVLVQGVSGLMSLTGAPDTPPFRSGISVFDVFTGLHSAVGILAALHHRDVTGEGQHIETNLLSTALSAMVNQTSAYVAGGVVPHRMGNSHLSLFPYEPLATGDGDLIIAVGNDRQFRRLAAALGAPELADDERFRSVGRRNDNREELRPLLLERLAIQSAQESFGILTEAGIPCGPINDVRGGVELAASLGLEPVVMTGDVPTVRNPIRMSATPPRHELPPPALNADGDDIRAWLGFGSRKESTDDQ